jgi:siroheme synthase
VSARPDPAPSVWLCAASLAGDSFEALLQAPALGDADAVLVDAGVAPALVESLRRATRHVELVAASESARDAATRRLVQLAHEGWRVVRCFDGVDAAEAAFTGDALGRAGIGFGVIGTGGVAATRALGAPPPAHPVATETWAGLAG